jgi:hypothetical protein
MSVHTLSEDGSAGKLDRTPARPSRYLLDRTRLPGFRDYNRDSSARRPAD